MYEIAKEYYNKNGNLNISSTYVTENGDKIGQWLAQQRRIKRGTLKHSIVMDEERLKKIKNLDIIWEHEKTSWDEYYNLLAEYVAKTGNAKPIGSYKTSDGITLGRWVSFQRGLYNKGKLSDDKIKKLNLLGFVWNVDEDRWERKLAIVKEYHKKYGNTHLTKDILDEEGEKVSDWWNRVKRKYKEEPENIPEKWRKLVEDLQHKTTI